MYFGYPGASGLRKFYHLYSIDKDLEAKQAEARKVSGSSRVIGGRSLWGNLFDAALSKYGWTLDYLLWGISFQNITMLLSDSIQTYSTANDKTLDAEDKLNQDYIIQNYSE